MNNCCDAFLLLGKMMKPWADLLSCFSWNVFQSVNINHYYQVIVRYYKNILYDKRNIYINSVNTKTRWPSSRQEFFFVVVEPWLEFKNATVWGSHRLPASPKNNWSPTENLGWQWPMANDNTNYINLSNGMAARPAGWEAPPPIVAEITTRWALGKPLRRKAQSCMSRVKGTS